jgi:hypothetical protein
MKHFQSKELESDRSAEELYPIISDFHNLGRLMPEQILDWDVSGDDTCSFTIKNMADISLTYQKRVTDRYVVIESLQAPFRLELTIDLSRVKGHRTACNTSLKADLNPMLAMLASRALQHLVDSINLKLATEAV